MKSRGFTLIELIIILVIIGILAVSAGPVFFDPDPGAGATPPDESDGSCCGVPVAIARAPGRSEGRLQRHRVSEHVHHVGRMVCSLGGATVAVLVRILASSASRSSSVRSLVMIWFAIFVSLTASVISPSSDVAMMVATGTMGGGGSVEDEEA